MKVYEEVSGVICSYNVSFDFYIDWLYSINAGTRKRGNWSGWSTGSAGSTCASAGQIVDAVYLGVYPRQEDIPQVYEGQVLPECRYKWPS